MSNEQSVMRTSLRASVLQTVASNLRRERGIVALFECARVYLTKQGDLPEERELLIGAVAGNRLGRWGEPTEHPVDFFDAKGLLEDVFERCSAAIDFKPGDEYAFLRGATAKLLARTEAIGVLGQVHPQVAARFEINVPVFLFEVDVAGVLPALKAGPRYSQLSRFPAVLQDISLLLDASVGAADVTRAIASSALVSDAKLFDLYEGPELPQGKKSLAYKVQFQSLEKTLTDAEVAEARGRIVRRLQHEFGAELRGA
jgi:phenylalanyl-tRNA synthetase beta chain